MVVGEDVLLLFKEAIKRGDEESIDFLKEELASRYEISSITFSDLGTIVILEEEQEDEEN